MGGVRRAKITLFLAIALPTVAREPDSGWHSAFVVSVTHEWIDSVHNEPSLEPPVIPSPGSRPALYDPGSHVRSLALVEHFEIQVANRVYIAERVTQQTRMTYVPIVKENGRIHALVRGNQLRFKVPGGKIIKQRSLITTGFLRNVAVVLFD